MFQFHLVLFLPHLQRAPRSSVPFSKRKAFRNQDLGVRCAHCYWDVSTSPKTDLDSRCVHTHTHAHFCPLLSVKPASSHGFFIFPSSTVGFILPFSTFIFVTHFSGSVKLGSHFYSICTYLLDPRMSKICFTIANLCKKSLLI